MTPKEQMWAVLQEPSDLAPIPHGSHVIGIEDFIHNVECGAFIDYDGFGRWATQTRMSYEFDVYPSKVKSWDQIAPTWATHVVWYNR